MTSKKQGFRSNRGSTSISSTSQKVRYGGSSSVEAFKKGPWTLEEDALLIKYVKIHGDRHWNCVQQMGLMRRGKSCRLRWMNHLRPDLKKGAFSSDEEKIVIELHQRFGNKWAKIATKLPGRTDNEVKNFWNTKIKRKMKKNSQNILEENITPLQKVYINNVTHQNLQPNNNEKPHLVIPQDPIMLFLNNSSYKYNLFLEDVENQNNFVSPQSISNISKFPISHNSYLYSPNTNQFTTTHFLEPNNNPFCYEPNHITCNGDHKTIGNPQMLQTMFPSMQGNAGWNGSPLMGMEKTLKVEQNNCNDNGKMKGQGHLYFDGGNYNYNDFSTFEIRPNELQEEIENMDEELSSLLHSFSSY